MELKEAIATAQLMKNQFRAFQRIEELLSAASQFIKEMDEQNSILEKLKSEVDLLQINKAALISEMKKNVSESREKAEAEAASIIAAATGQAKKDAEMIISSAEKIVSDLNAKKTALASDISMLTEAGSRQEAGIKASILKLETQKASLEAEVSTLTTARENLLAQVAAIKEKFASIVM